MNKREFEADTLAELNKQLDLAGKKSAPNAEFNPFSLRSLSIEMIFGEQRQPLAKATGFLYKHKGVYWLITNLHNLTGVNIETRRRISSYASSPTEIIIPLLLSTNGRLVWENAIYPLYTGSNTPTWSIHPEFGTSVDVGAIPLNVSGKTEALEAINDSGLQTSAMRIRVADDAFIVGYPQGINTSTNVPIWKRGTIASEPDIDIDDLPKIYVDTASREGMSGSPVIFRRFGLNNTGSHDYTLLGIYSGRRISPGKTEGEDTKLDSQLGVIWKARVIDEIIEGGKQDNIYYPNVGFTGAQ